MRERKIALEDAMPLIKEALAQGQEALFSPSGTSMLPTLMEGRDTVVLVAPPTRLRKYDIALYRRENGQYVLHRVVNVKDTYTFAGDNCLQYDKGIAPAQVIAYCTAYIREGERKALASFSCRMRARILHHLRPLRRVARGVLRSLGGAVDTNSEKDG